MTDRQKVSLATLASICLHLLMLGLLMLWTAFGRQNPSPRPEELKPLEVTLVAPKPTPALPSSSPSPTPPLLAEATATPTPSPTPGEKILPKKILRTFLDLTGLHQTQEAPENALFESDRNSQAASELPARGDLPLPSQDGKKRPDAEFANIDYLLGEVRPAAPQFLAKQELSVANEPPPEESEPKAKATSFADMPEPVATPTPPAPVNGFALGRPTPVPPKAKPTPVPKSTVKIAPPPPRPMPAPRLAMPKPGYQPEKEKTRIDGAISNPGRAGVAAIGTPLGRYYKAVGDAVGSRWYFYMHQRTDLVSAGEARVHFYVNSQGQVENVRVMSNTANDTFAGVGIRSVTEAKIPPIPPEVLDTVSGGRVEITYKFTGYDD